MAQLRRLEDQYSNELVVIGVHSAKFPSERLARNIYQAVLRLDIRHPVVNDAGFRVWDAYAVRGWPTLVLVDPNGRVADRRSGEILASEYAAAINDVIAANRDSLNLEPLDLSSGSQPEPESLLRFPSKVLLGPGRSLFIADSGHNRILQVELSVDRTRGEITAVFGSGKAGMRGGNAAEAEFYAPHGLALKGGTLYVADTGNHAVRAVDLASGMVRTVAGTGQKAHGSFQLGHPREVPLRSPWALAALDQYVFVAMAGSHQIWVLIDEQQIVPFAGTGAEALVDGPPDQASFNQPSDLAFGLGHLFVADAEASAVRALRLDENPVVVTLVGQGLFEFGDIDGVGEVVRLQHPEGLAVDGDLVYIADTYNHKIKLLDPATGEVSTLAGSGEAGLKDGALKQARFYEPEGVQVANGKVFVADTNNHAVRVIDLDAQSVDTLLLYYRANLVVREQQRERLAAVELSPGKGRITLEPLLPAGTKRNPEGEASVAVGEDHPALYYFAPDEPLVFEIDIDSDVDLVLGVALLYCESGNASLCRVDSRDLLLPVKVRPGAPEEARVSYQVVPSQ